MIGIVISRLIVDIGSSFGIRCRRVWAREETGEILDPAVPRRFIWAGVVSAPLSGMEFLQTGISGLTGEYSMT